jgi:hypothetical protein
MNKVDLAGEMNYVSGPHIVGRKDPLFFSVRKVSSQVLQYSNNQIHAAGLKRGILCELMQTVISDSF